ncbi:terminase large subunit domain-containing protein [Sinorhizobium meliloti]|uniref:terminase large subunit domain-containing protein n=1 Tax=Rhizobium meliloti TaxID=382 RepID=UPI00227802F5|nr:terminase family protein [Sinorhizobium meliloti]
MEPLCHITNPQFGAVFFRRSTVQVRNEGGLWDESEKLYLAIGASPKEHVLQWSFPSGASVSIAHLEHDRTVLNWQGSQIPLISFDELTHFSASSFQVHGFA